MQQHIDIIGRDGRKRRARKGETLQDGERFSMQFMDEEARAVAHHLAEKYRHPAATADAMITDAAGAMAGHRPGFLYSNADCATLADAEATTVYEERSRRMRERWKKPEDNNNLPAPGEQEAAWQRRQMLARKATAATMGKDAAPTLDQARAQADQAWRDRSTRLQNAWKHD